MRSEVLATLVGVIGLLMLVVAMFFGIGAYEPELTTQVFNFRLLVSVMTGTIGALLVMLGMLRR